MGLRGRRSSSSKTTSSEQVEDILKPDKTFAESEGLPANAHAKKLAKEKAAKAKQETPQGVFYTIRGHKVLKMLVKANGAYTVYIGNMKRHKDGLDPMIAKWKADKVWVGADSVEEKIAALQLELAKK